MSHKGIHALNSIHARQDAHSPLHWELGKTCLSPAKGLVVISNMLSVFMTDQKHPWPGSQKKWRQV